MPYFIGTAGWNVPRESAKRFPQPGTHLERYARMMNCVEINSSFYRSHSFITYRRWAESTSATFRFAVKVPSEITHDARLRRSRVLIEKFLSDVKGLGRKLGPLLIQLPPSMEFEARVVARFFGLLRERHRGAVVCEPRHPSWFDQRAERVFLEYGVSRVAADPPLDSAGAKPGGATRRLVYYRLHGTPRMYWSNYPRERLRGWATELRERSGGAASWVIFDNTAAGCATLNALQLRDQLTVNK